MRVCMSKRRDKERELERERERGERERERSERPYTCKRGRVCVCM